jgi:hypothetical protein
MIDCDAARTRTNHIRLMGDTLKILGFILAGVTAEQATTLRDPSDGQKGWTITEVICHLRDFDEIFFRRARMMVEQANPLLPGYDHNMLVIERNYNSQDFRQVLVISVHRASNLCCSSGGWPRSSGRLLASIPNVAASPSTTR